MLFLLVHGNHTKMRTLEISVELLGKYQGLFIICYVYYTTTKP